MKHLALIYFTFYSAFIFSQTENRSVCTTYKGKIPDQLIHFHIPEGNISDLQCIDSLFVNHKCLPLSIINSQDFDYDFQYCGLDANDITIRIYHSENCTPEITANWKRKPKKTIVILEKK